MANIDNLNFEVILKDEEFKRKVDENMELAKKLNTSLSTLLDLQSKIKQSGIKVTAQGTNDAIRQQRLATATSQAAAAEERLNTAKINGQAASERLATAAANRANAESRAAKAAIQMERAQRGVAESANRANRAYQQQSALLGGLKSLAMSYLSVQGASRLLSSLVKVTGEFELQKTTLSAMLGDLNAAESILAKIKGLAVESPFQFKELATYTKQLSAFAVPAQELYDTTKMLADVSAGLGVGMDRIVLAYGQVRAAAFLRGQEVRQFTEAGIPILNELAKQFTELEGRVVSTTEVFDKISSRLVPFEMVAKVFKDMTSEGGKFYNMQEVQAETLKGKISNLKDAYEMMLNEIGKGQSENIKGAVEMVHKLMKNYEETGRILVELIVTYGAYKTALLGLSLVTGTFNTENHKLIGTLAKLGNFLASNPYVLVAAGVAALGYSIYKSATQLESFEKIQNAVTKTQNDFTKSLATEQTKLDALYAKLKLAKEGSEEYESVKKAIYTQFAPYIAQLKEEGVAVDNLATIYENLVTKIEEAQKARFKTLASENINRVYDNELTSILNETDKAIERLLKKTAFELNDLEKEAVRAYVAGTLSMEDLSNDQRLTKVSSLLKNAAASGNEAWMQFATSIEAAKIQMEQSTNAYKEGLDAIEKIYGVTEDKGEDNLNPLGRKTEEDVEASIRSQIKSIQKLQDAYEKLRAFLSDEQLKSTLKTLFPNISESVIESLDFTTELERLANELARFDKEAAKNLKESIGKDVAGEIANSFKAVEEYRKSLEKWFSEDFNLSGKGIAFDISKIISDLNGAYGKIDQKRMKNLELLAKAQLGDEEALKVVRETYGEEVWQKYIVDGKNAIEQLAYAERTEAKKTADEKIRDLASKYVSEKLAEKNIDITDLADKTISQVQTQINRLNELVIEVDKERSKILAEMMNGDIVEGQVATWEMLSKVADLLGIKIEDLGETVEDKLTDQFVKTLESVSDLGSQLGDLGEAVGSDLLADFGKEISTVSKEVSSLVKAMEAKDTIAIVSNLLSMFIRKVTDSISIVMQYQEDLNKGTREYLELQNEIRRNSYDGIFGTDEIGKSAENLKILDEAQERYNSALKEFDKVRFQAAGFTDRFRKNSLAGVMQDLAKEEGWNLYLENGELNIAALEAYYDAYSVRLSRKQKKLVQNLIEEGNAVTSAAEQQAEYLRSLFSGTADDIANSFIEAFKESGEAALDYGELMDDIATNMAKDVIKSMLLQNVFSDEIAKQAGEKLASGDTAAALAIIDESFKAAQELAPYVQELLKGIEPYLQMEQPETAETLGEGIKGITEDTANLLASYLNAMRSDVSQMRTIQAQHLPIISAAMPTIMDHLAQINAHTFDTAQNTQSILSELISINGKFGKVIGAGSDGTAIKVLM